MSYTRSTVLNIVLLHINISINRSDKAAISLALRAPELKYDLWKTTVLVALKYTKCTDKIALHQVWHESSIAKKAYHARSVYLFPTMITTNTKQKNAAAKAIEIVWELFCYQYPLCLCAFLCARNRVLLNSEFLCFVSTCSFVAQVEQMRFHSHHILIGVHLNANRWVVKIVHAYIQSASAANK